MARKKKVSAAKPLTAAQKKRFLDQIAAAEKSVKSLTASVKTMRKAAAAATYVGAKPAPARKRRRKRG
jgi:hypothetical protein